MTTFPTHPPGHHSSVKHPEPTPGNPGNPGTPPTPGNPGTPAVNPGQPPANEVKEVKRREPATPTACSPATRSATATDDAMPWTTNKDGNVDDPKKPLPDSMDADPSHGDDRPMQATAREWASNNTESPTGQRPRNHARPVTASHATKPRTGTAEPERQHQHDRSHATSSTSRYPDNPKLQSLDIYQASQGPMHRKPVIDLHPRRWMATTVTRNTNARRARLTGCSIETRLDARRASTTGSHPPSSTPSTSRMSPPPSPGSMTTSHDHGGNPEQHRPDGPLRRRTPRRTRRNRSRSTRRKHRQITSRSSMEPSCSMAPPTTFPPCSTIRTCPRTHAPCTWDGSATDEAPGPTPRPCSRSIAAPTFHPS